MKRSDLLRAFVWWEKEQKKSLVSDFYFRQNLKFSGFSEVHERHM